jgi:pimeloyl-ACP methyl ester carboxylesterase
MAPRGVVLVHGAWHGAWVWDRVLPLLRSAGVDAVALDLPGHGADASPLGDLHADSRAVTRALDGLGSRGAEPVLLVGHSYGGAVITEAGAHPAVAGLVYLAAFPLRADESCARAAPDEGADIDHSGRPDLSAGFIHRQDGSITLERGLAAECFYSDCDPSATAWALERLGPQLAASLTQSPTEAAWLEKPSTYVVCSQDRATHPDLQRILARRCTSSVEWPTGHSPFLSQPERVAGLLVDLSTAD